MRANMGKVNKLTEKNLCQNNDDFDWTLYENGYHGGNLLVTNSSVKVKNKKDKVYCHESYAQDLYNMMVNHTEGRPVNESKDMLKGSLHNVTNINVVSDHEILIDTASGSSAIVDLNKERQYLENIGVSDYSELIDNLKASKEYKQSLIDIGIVGKVVNGGRISLWEGHLSEIEKEFMDQINNTAKPCAYYAEVKEINGGGYTVDIMGVQCFMPGSLAAAGILTDFNALLGKTIPVMIVNYIRTPKPGFVVSYKKYLNTILPLKIENELSIGMEVYARVTGTSKNGIFIQFKDNEGEWLFSGLIHRSVMSKDFEKRFDAREFRNGDEFRAFIHNIVEVDGKWRIVVGDKMPELNEETDKESNE